jgi:4'-phosphopantetheinyl transferase
MIEVFAVRLIDNEAYELIRDKLISGLPPAGQNRVKRFKRPRDEQRSLLGELMVRSVISEKLSVQPNKIIINYSEKGKPFTDRNLRFNLSHSGNWVVAAFGNTTVGIDIEKIKPANFRVAERFFSDQEKKDLQLLQGNEKLNYFFDLWTLKESYLKLLGKGLTRALNTFTVKKSGRIIQLEDLSGKDEKVFFRQYYPEEGYICSVCSFSDQFAEKVRFETAENLI